MIPTCCALAFIAQHRANTWPGIVGHTFGNIPLLLQILRGIVNWNFAVVTSITLIT